MDILSLTNTLLWWLGDFNSKARKSQDSFKYISDYIRLKDECHIHQGWLEEQ